MKTLMHRYCSQALFAEKKIFRRELAIQSSGLLSVIIPSRGFTSFDRYSIVGEYGAYAKQYDESIRSPETFWKEAAKSLHWFEEPQTTLRRDKSNSYLYDWFPDGMINTSYNCLDVHVKDGRGDQTALIYDSPMTGRKDEYTYKQFKTKE